MKRVPSFAALRFGTTSDAQDWVASSSPRFRLRSIELAPPQHEQHLLILAVAHAKRRPLYWLTRVNP
ncbi:MAG: hypothetical protein DMF96_31045 [Acidobacteria bacterium]|nr:MAG: hypothetical protein DMF96_31045 [Acidobacteriota bacterium]